MTYPFAEGDTVLFTARGSHIHGRATVVAGTIASVQADRREVHIHYMYGAKDDWQMTSFDDVLAVVDPTKKASYIRIENFSGPLIDLRQKKA